MSVETFHFLPWRRARYAVGLCAVVAVVACNGDASGPSPQPSAAPSLPEPARPTDLAAYVVVATPRTTLPLLREHLADVAGWPGGFGSLVSTLAGLPITCAELVSDDEPVGASVLLGDAQEVVVAVHLRAADRLQGLATSGSSAPFRAVPGEGGVVRLEPMGTPGPYRLALFGNHLLVGTSDGAIARAGAFTARAPRPTLAEGELVAMDLGARAPALAQQLLRRGVASLPAAVAAAIGVTADAPVATPFEAELAALEGGHASIRWEDGAVAFTLTIGDSPLTRLAAAALPRVAPAPWLALPNDAAIAVMLHRGPSLDEARPSDDLASALGLAGVRRERVGAAMQALDGARSGPLVVAAGATPDGPALWFRAPLADVAAADRALDALADAIGAKPREERPSVTARPSVVTRVGDVLRLRVRADGPADRPPIDVLLRREGDVLWGATGLDAPTQLQALRNAPDGAHLASDPFASRVAALAESHVALGVLDVEGIAALVRARPRPTQRRAHVGASIAVVEGRPTVRVLAEPSALAPVREMLGRP